MAHGPVNIAGLANWVGPSWAIELELVYYGWTIYSFIMVDQIVKQSKLSRTSFHSNF